MSAQLLSAVLNGLTSGAGLAAIALPFVFVTRATGVFNFAFGSTVTFAALGIAGMTANSHIPWILIACLWLLIGAALGGVTYGIAVAPLDRASSLSGYHLSLVTTLAAGLILQTVSYAWWGGNSFQMTPPLTGQWHVFSDVYVTIYSLLFFVVVIAEGCSIEIWLRRSGSGLIWRAMGDDRVLAQLRGVSWHVRSIIIFAIGGGMASLAGIGIVASQPVSYSDSLNLTFAAFLVVGFVGFHSLWGTVVAGIIYGVVQSVMSLYLNPNLSEILITILLIIVLCYKPAGLLGRRQLREV
jgi:branched-subunit amino acid ABC-type transport system permease component